MLCCPIQRNKDGKQESDFMVRNNRSNKMKIKEAGFMVLHHNENSHQFKKKSVALQTRLSSFSAVEENETCAEDRSFS